MTRREFFVTTAIVLICATTAVAAQGFHWDSNVLYQPDEDLRARIGSVEEVVAYMKRIDAVCTAFFESEKTPERLDIVVGLKPQKRVRIWFVSSRRTSQDKSLIILRKKLEAIPPCAVHRGPVAFALRCAIAGAPASNDVPMPKEWWPKSKEPDVVPDGVFKRIWPD